MNTTPPLTQHSAISTLLNRASRLLEEEGFTSPRLDAEVLLCFALGIDRTSLYSSAERIVGEEDEAEFMRLVSMRTDGCPVQQITGRQEFWSLEFKVDRRALIPRPETELLVEEGVRLLRGLAGHIPSREPWILDMGTGSGNIAVALAWEIPSARIVAADISRDALELARENVIKHHLQDRVILLQGDLCRHIRPEPGVFDLVVSNPPYVSDQEWETLPASVRDFEPHVALKGGADGLEVVSELVRQVPPLLTSGAHFIFEIGYGMAERVRALVGASPHLRLERVIPDYSGIERVAVTRKTG